MAEKDNWEKRLSDNSLTILVGILVVAVISVALVIGFYVAYFRSFPIEANAAPWGQFGDFFGGTLNPIFGFLSVMALLAALVIQGRELRVSSEELKNSVLALNAQNKAIAHQSFEQTFFSWLDNYRAMLGSISQPIPTTIANGAELRGRLALEHWREHYFRPANLADKLGNKLAEYKDLPIKVVLQLAAKNNPQLLTDEVMGTWESLYQECEYQLDSLFRNLYRLILWIDTQDESRLNVDQKWVYVSIVRAQLSWIEMLYLFYNGHTERGSKFKPLVEKYALFDNLNFGSDQAISHVKEFPPSNKCYEDTAFDSNLARKKIGLTGGS